jgi:dTDP-4-dehydrorhamnose reductase
MTRILVVGRTGQLGCELGNMVWPGSVQLLQAGRSECDVTVPEMVRNAVLGANPDVVINAAAYTAVDRAEQEQDAAMRTNADGPAALARSCAETGAALIHLSTDYVFDGTKTTAYREDDIANPKSVYGRSKFAGELAIRELLLRHVIIRSSWVFSSHGSNFVKTMLRLGSRQPAVRVVIDQMGAPTSARDIAGAIGVIANAIAKGRGVWGTFHFSSAEPSTWFGFAEAVFAGSAHLHHVNVIPITSADFGALAVRPANSVLDCSRIRDAYGIDRPSWRVALCETLAELESSEPPP